MIAFAIEKSTNNKRKNYTMEQTIQYTDGNWEILPEQHLLLGAKNINIANFNNRDIPAEERLGNLILCGAAKKMHQSIEQTTKLLTNYINSTENEPFVPNHDKSRLFISRMQFILSQLQWRLPKVLKSKHKAVPDITDSLLAQVKVIFESLPKDKKASTKQEIIEYLMKQH